MEGMIIVLILAILLGAWCMKGQFEVEAEKKEKIEKIRIEKENNKKVEFYNMCKKHNITDLKDPIQRQRAEAILHNLGIYRDVDVVFKEAFASHKEKVKQANISRINTIRQQEENKCRELTKWCNYRGRDKRVAILENEISELRSATNAARQLGVAMMNSAYQEKERDWAIAGGLGGVGAAVDAQLENIEIRARNQANRSAVQQSAKNMMSNMSSDILNTYGKISDLEEQLKKAKIALVSDETPEELLKLIDFSNIAHSITETGAVHITGTIKLKQKHFIFDKINAVIDGTIFADVYQNGVKQGTAIIVFPDSGISTTKRKIESYCLCKVSKALDIEIKYSVDPATPGTPGSIWAMEK